MAIVPYSQQTEYDLVHNEQDCRGWAVVDAQGNAIGRVSEMMVDTDTDLVSHLVLEDGKEIPARSVALQNGTVVVGLYGTTTETTRSTTTEGTSSADMRGASTAAAGLTTTDSAGAQRSEGEVALPVIEEQIRVGKRAVESGGVRVHTRVEEVPVEDQVSLREEHVTVERRPANQPIDATQVEAFKEGVIEVTETSEEAVISKQARVVEEVVVGKEVQERTETVRDTVRRTDVDVEQLNPNIAPNRRDS